MERMTQEEKSELDEIVAAIKGAVDAKAIYLFGSFAYGNPTRDSDFDIYVVIPDGSARPIQAMQDLRFAIRPVKRRPVDLLVGTETNFEKRKTWFSSIEREVFDKGLKVA